MHISTVRRNGIRNNTFLIPYLAEGLFQYLSSVRGLPRVHCLGCLELSLIVGLLDVNIVFRKSF